MCVGVDDKIYLVVSKGEKQVSQRRNYKMLK